MPRTTEAWEFAGGASFTGGASFPSAAATDATIASGANVSQAKLNHRIHVHHAIAGGTNAANFDMLVYRAYTAGTILQAKVAVDVVGNGNSTLTVDMLRCASGGNAFVSVLTANYALDANSTAKTPIALTLNGNTTTLAAGDLVKFTGVAAGTGTQMQGVLIDAQIDEHGV